MLTFHDVFDLFEKDAVKLSECIAREHEQYLAAQSTFSDWLDKQEFCQSLAGDKDTLAERCIKLKVNSTLPNQIH